MCNGNSIEKSLIGTELLPTSKSIRPPTWNLKIISIKPRKNISDSPLPPRLGHFHLCVLFLLKYCIKTKPSTNFWQILHLLIIENYFWYSFHIGNFFTDFQSESSLSLSGKEITQPVSGPDQSLSFSFCWKQLASTSTEPSLRPSMGPAQNWWTNSLSSKCKLCHSEIVFP